MIGPGGCMKAPNTGVEAGPRPALSDLARCAPAVARQIIRLEQRLLHEHLSVKRYNAAQDELARLRNRAGELA